MLCRGILSSDPTPRPGAHSQYFLMPCCPPQGQAEQ